MKIGNVSRDTAFRGLRINFDTGLLKSKTVKKEFELIKAIIHENGFSKKKYVNVILNYDSYRKKFIGIVESKKQGVPNNPFYKKEISSNQKVIEAFKDWLNHWDYSYSPKGLKETKTLTKNILEGLESLKDTFIEDMIKRQKAIYKK